ncbi:hypothetical protein ES708_10152 [subsurface metagenome]
MVTTKSTNQNAHIYRVRKTDSTLVSFRVATERCKRRRSITPKRMGATGAVQIVTLHNLEVFGGLYIYCCLFSSKNRYAVTLN